MKSKFAFMYNYGGLIFFTTHLLLVHVERRRTVRLWDLDRDWAGHGRGGGRGEHGAGVVAHQLARGLRGVGLLGLARLLTDQGHEVGEGVVAVGAGLVVLDRRARGLVSVLWSGVVGGGGDPDGGGLLYICLGPASCLERGPTVVLQLRH